MSSRGEFRRLAALAPYLAGSGPGLPVGVGDDAAVVGEGAAAVVACLDVLVEDVHFRRDRSTPADVGWKAVAVNISDLAAMGARPEALLVGLQRPATLSEADVEELYRGMADAGRAYGADIVGGDTVTGPVWAISVTALGRPTARVVTRGGARPGDRVGLVGELGAAAAALWGEQQGLEVPEALWAAHRRPRALPRSGMALAAVGATAMIDISDGLGADAAHVATASDVVLRLAPTTAADCAAAGIEDLVPAAERARIVLGGGEDFALLVTVPPPLQAEAERALDAAGEGRLRWIGVVEEPAEGAAAGSVWWGPDRIDAWGYDHG